MLFRFWFILGLFRSYFGDIFGLFLGYFEGLWRFFGRPRLWYCQIAVAPDGNAALFFAKALKDLIRPFLKSVLGNISVLFLSSFLCVSVFFCFCSKALKGLTRHLKAF